jgi:DMSO/TMAO reductase YedYZ heme-binding membrane subunit
MILSIGAAAVAVLFVVVCRNPLRRFPVVFYLIAVALDIFVAFSSSIVLPKDIQLYIMVPLQRGSFAFALFASVMFIGVFKDDSKIRAYLMPIRAELSIIACLLILGHVLRRLSVYIKLFVAPVPTAMTHIAISIALAVFLTLLMAVLGITSVKAIRKKILPSTWKKIQLLAYPFFILIYAHIALIFLPSMMNNGTAATESFVIYSIVFALYLVLRIRKALSVNSAVKQLETP